MEIIDQLENLENQAVDAAVNFDWELAVEINKKIVKLDKKNLSAYLRLGFACIQIKKFDAAVKYYLKALRIQPNNNVAKENLERVKVLQSKKSKLHGKILIHLDPNLFLEISGKTKSVALVNLGQKNILAQFFIGQEVFLKNKKRKVEVRTRENEYVGSLPDDLSRRLLVFLKAKSKYRVFIKEATLSKINIFICEEKKGKRVQQYLSFPKDIQSPMDEIRAENDDEEEDSEVDEADLEKLAESLTSEEKEYLPYQSESDEEETDE